MGRRDGNKVKEPKNRRSQGRGYRPADHGGYEHPAIQRDARAYNALMDERATEGYKRKLDEHQSAYYKQAMFRGRNPVKMVILDEKAGTGKTTIAFITAVEALRSGKVDRIIYLRFPTQRGQQLGFLPGDLSEKQEPYMIPAYEALAECGLQPEAVAKLIEDGSIVLTTDTMLRGTNIQRSFLIIDEAQSAVDLPQMRLVLTRIHDSAKTILIGDSGQRDGKVQTYYGHTAFQVYQRHLLSYPWTVRLRLPNNYRGVVSQASDEVEKTLELLKQEAREHDQIPQKASDH